MTRIFADSAFFGAFISLFSYWLGTLLRKKTGLRILNPLLVSILLTIGVLLLLDVDYQSYYASARYLNWLLTPATVCLAIPLYEQLQILRDNWKAILTGIFAGVLSSLTSVFLMSMAFGLTHAQYVTLLPKSVTTAIGAVTARELGGDYAVAAVVIILTGVLGNVFAESWLKLLGVKNRIARGVAIGASSHAIGTSRAMEMGDTEGAMSSLSIVAAGLMTVVGASVFAQFM